MVKGPQPLERLLLNKCKGLLKAEPLIWSGPKAHRRLTIQAYTVVETHHRRGPSSLAIFFENGKLLFNAQYLPWQVFTFHRSDLGWMQRFLGLLNAAFVKKAINRQAVHQASLPKMTPLLKVYSR